MTNYDDRPKMVPASLVPDQCWKIDHNNYKDKISYIDFAYLRI
jgi:hypothetical protein